MDKKETVRVEIVADPFSTRYIRPDGSPTVDGYQKALEMLTNGETQAEKDLATKYVAGWNVGVINQTAALGTVATAHANRIDNLNQRVSQLEGFDFVKDAAETSKSLKGLGKRLETAESTANWAFGLSVANSAVLLTGLIGGGIALFGADNRGNNGGGGGNNGGGMLG